MASTKMIEYAKKRVKELEDYIELLEGDKTQEFSTGYSLYEELNRLNRMIRENK